MLRLPSPSPRVPRPGCGEGAQSLCTSLLQPRTASFVHSSVQPKCRPFLCRFHVGNWGSTGPQEPLLPTQTHPRHCGPFIVMGSNYRSAAGLQSGPQESIRYESSRQLQDRREEAPQVFLAVWAEEMRGEGQPWRTSGWRFSNSPGCQYHLLHLSEMQIPGPPASPRCSASASASRPSSLHVREQVAADSAAAQTSL